MKIYPNNADFVKMDRLYKELYIFQFLPYNIEYRLSLTFGLKLFSFPLRTERNTETELSQAELSIFTKIETTNTISLILILK